MQFIIPQTVDLRRENPMLRYGQPLGYGDAGAHKWCVTVLDGGKAADLAGTKATCYFTRAANTAELEQGALIVTVPMEIATVGNPVEIEFEKACYAGVGRCVAEIRLTKDGRTTTLARMAAELARYTSDSISDPEHLLPSIDELLAQQKAMIAATEAGQAAASAANAAATKANTAATKANTAAAAADGWAKATVTTETLEAGMDADVTLNTAESGAKVLEFAIPRGNPGVQVGHDEPTDPTVQVWIDTDGEPDDLSGLISDERIQTAVDSYLEENGVASGATAEQAAQIAKNTEAIEDLKENGVGTPGKDGRGIVSMTSDAVLGTPVNVVYTDGTGEVFYVRSGTSGRDGVSPTIQIVDIEGGHMVRITDEEGMKFFEVMDGTDYVLTEEDKQEIAGMIESGSGTGVYIGPTQPTNGVRYWLDTSGSSGGEEPEEPDEPTSYSVTANLTHVTSDNSAETASEGASYSATLTAEEGYVLSSVTITMGGADITGSNYDGATGQIYIAAVTGDIVITAEATEQAEDVTMYSITNNLSGCTTSNSALTIEEGAAYSAAITASDGYTLAGATISVMMSGLDITANAYADGVIAIASVTGDIVININCAQLGGTITESVPLVAVETLDNCSTSAFGGTSTNTILYRIDGVKTGDVIVTGSNNGDRPFAHGAQESGVTRFEAADSQITGRFMDNYGWKEYTFTAAQDYDVFWVHANKTLIGKPSFTSLEAVVTWTHTAAD